MSAANARIIAQNVITELGVARSQTLNAMQRTVQSISVLQGLESNSVDVDMAIQGLRQTEQDLLTVAADIDQHVSDINNYRWSL